MSEKHCCDFCGKPIEDVMYVITAKSATGGNYIRGGTELHYDCIIGWRTADA